MSPSLACERVQSAYSSSLSSVSVRTRAAWASMSSHRAWYILMPLPPLSRMSRGSLARSSVSLCSDRRRKAHPGWVVAPGLGLVRMGAGHMCCRPLRTSAYVGRGERYLVGRVSDCCPAPLVLSGLACIEATQRRMGGGRSSLQPLPATSRRAACVVTLTLGRCLHLTWGNECVLGIKKGPHFDECRTCGDV